jgi:hypothetical protein
MALRASEKAARIARQNAEPFGALHVWCEAMLAREPETPKMRKHRIMVMSKAFGH